MFIYIFVFNKNAANIFYFTIKNIMHFYILHRQNVD